MHQPSKLKGYQFARCLVIVIAIAVTFIQSENGLLGLLILISPLLIVLLLAKPSCYSTKLRVFIRLCAVILICALSILQLITIYQGLDMGVGILYLVFFQWGVLFISEAAIGLLGDYERLSDNRPPH